MRAGIFSTALGLWCAIASEPNAVAQAHSPALVPSLLSCQAAFRSALRESEAAKADALLQLCEPHVELLLRMSAADSRLSLSSTQKRRMLAGTERLLRLLRDLVVRARSFPSGATSSTPYMARVTSFENALRIFYERLSELETWTVNTGMSLGVSHAADGSIEPIGGAFAFLLLDHGSRVAAGFELATATPLREESGTVELPPREIDTLAMSQLWLEFKRYRNFQLKLGIFPDAEGFFTPHRWPFVSLQGRVFLVRTDGFDLALALRHDVFGTFSPQQTNATARLFERDLSELIGAYDTVASEVDWQLRAGWRLHWYTDSQRKLADLSVGRRRYLERGSAPEGTRYRVSDRFASVRASIAEGVIAATLKAEGWNNVLAGPGSRGSYFGSELQSTLGAFELTGEYAFVRVGCESLPPVALRQSLLPGTTNHVLEGQIAYAPSNSLQLFTRVARNASSARPAPGACPNVTMAALSAYVPDFEMLFGFVYKIPDDAGALR